MLSTARTINQARPIRTPGATRLLRPGSLQAEPTDSLTHRQVEIIRLLCDGKSSNEIAWDLHISPKTVDTHRANILAKLELHKTALLVRWAIRKGIIQP